MLYEPHCEQINRSFMNRLDLANYCGGAIKEYSSRVFTLDARQPGRLPNGFAAFGRL
jgi:hypothetical protein